MMKKIMWGIIILFILGAMGGGSKGSKSSVSIRANMGETFKVDDFSFNVEKTEYVNSIQDLNQFASESGSGIYLLVYVSVTNNASEAKLITSNAFSAYRGEAKYDYDASATMYAASKYKRQQLTKINPGITADGIVVFNLPDATNKTQLKVSPGFWGSTATVQIL